MMQRSPNLKQQRIWRLIILATCLGAVTQFGCRKRTKKSAPKLEVTAATSEVEERNLRALCSAAAEVRKQPGVQDRLARIAEVAAPTSATTELLDGLIALEGPKRLSTIKKLVAKYGIGQECKDGLPAFEVAADAPAPNAPTPPAADGSGAPPSTPGPTIAQPATNKPGPSAEPDGQSLGIRGAAPVLPPGRQPSTPPAIPTRSSAPAKPAFGGFRGLSVPQVAAAPRRTTASVSTSELPQPTARRPTLALPVGKAPVAAVGSNVGPAVDTRGGLRGLSVPNAPQSGDTGRVVSGGIKGLAAPMPKSASVGIRQRLGVESGVKVDANASDPKQQGQRPRFAPGGVRAETTSSPRFAPGGVRAD